MNSPFENILSRLEGVRHRGQGQASAKCPAHDDKSPSLSIRETPMGSVLLHCFGGCAVADVVAAMGLEMTDLFPPTERTGREPKRMPKVLSAAHALELLDREATLVALAGATVSQGKPFSEEDRERTLQAAGRVAWLRRLTGADHA